MSDIEKVLKGLEAHENSLCETDELEPCPYWSDTQCSSRLLADARALLEKQQEEIQNLRKENSSILKQFHEWSKEQNKKEKKFLQEINDLRSSISPAMAWEIITGEQKEGSKQDATD